MKILNRLGILIELFSVMTFIGHFTNGLDIFLSMLLLPFGTLLRANFGAKYTDKDIRAMGLKSAENARLFARRLDLLSYENKNPISFFNCA